MNKPSAARIRSLPVIIVAALLVLIGGAFLFELLSFDPRTIQDRPTAEDLQERAAALLSSGDPASGDQLIERLGCYACHRIGAENGIAPSFVGLAERAASAKPGLSAEAYILESILYPLVHVVEGFNAAMPQNYPETLSDQDLADLLAYLTSPGAQ
jgi:cytochrome c oxidase subunit 2